MSLRATFVGTCLATLSAAGCGGQVAILVKGVAPLNRNEKGESTAVRIRIYALRDAGKFSKAIFDALCTKDAEVLGDDRVGDPWVEIVASGKPEDPPRRIKLPELKSEVKFIGVVGLFSGKGETTEVQRVVLPRGEVDDCILEFSEYRIVLKRS